LVQIIANILSNAAKASEPEQTIEIDAASDSDCALRISVADQGPGIPASVMQILFQPFRRSGDPDRQKIKGIGLGLVVSQRLAELHIWRVTLESETGAKEPSRHSHSQQNVNVC